MRYLILFFPIFLFSFFIYCEELIVDIEGNGDYTSIQAAVEAAEDGDEIIVHPGTYYESVNLMGKQLELKSLFAVTGERHYISETIINGNETGSCIYSLDGGDVSLIITGFTLTGGSGTEYLTTSIYYGGGLYLQDNDAELSSCIIENNIKLDCGGGIALCHESNLELSDTIIRNNTASWFGGGIFFFNGINNFDFDVVNRCSIYNNYSPKGSDIYCQYEGGNQEVYLDTITVGDYEGYYIFQYLESPPWFTMEGLNIDYLNIWMESVDADLYVSPEGDNENSGLSCNDPLKSITWAMQKISVNPEEPHIIHLADGTYSASTTGEKMPFQCKDCTTIQGVSRNATIIDAEFATSFLKVCYGEYEFSLENLSFINCYPGYNLSIQTYGSFTGEYYLNNLLFEYNDSSSRILSLNCKKDLLMENVVFKNNGMTNFPYIFEIMMWNNYIHHDAYLNNITISYNQGSGILDGTTTSYPDFYVSNLLCTDNEKYYDSPNPAYNNYYSLLGISNGQNCYLINSTLAENTADIPSTSSAIQVGFFCNLEVINSIIYNNEVDYSINSINTFSGYEVNVHHSLIENGDGGINSILPFIYDYETNLDGDPMFSGDEDHPLSLQEYSPCIDAGTTEMPEGFTLPETDVMGNPRILGAGIDMGAYEYNPYSSPVNEEEVEYSELRFYPNPVRANYGRGSVTINYSAGSGEADYELNVYNIKGQRLRKLKIVNVKCKMNTIDWDCCDSDGEKVTAGVYFLRLSKDGEYIEQGKLTVIK